MAFLSNTTYNRIAKNSDKARLMFINIHGESSLSGDLVNFVKTKTRIKSRWETIESANIWPFTHAAIVINGKNIVMSGIKPMERTEYGFVDIDYEGETD